MKYCKCKESTSTVNSKCIVCGGDYTKKWEKARKDFEKYVEDELKKGCKCGGKLRHIMIQCNSFFLCLNECKQAKKTMKSINLLPQSTPSISVKPNYD